MGKKPGLKHFHVWGCLTKVRPYKSNEYKLEPKTMSSYFIGYAKQSKSFKFYGTTLRNIFKMGTVIFIEDVEFGEGEIRLKTLSLKNNWFNLLN